MSQSLYCVKDFSEHSHAPVLGADLWRNTCFPNWCTADGELCCDSNHERAAEGTVKAAYHCERSISQPAQKELERAKGHPPQGVRVPVFLMLLSFPLLQRWQLFPLWAGIQEAGCSNTPCSNTKANQVFAEELLSLKPPSRWNLSWAGSWLVQTADLSRPCSW